MKIKDLVKKINEVYINTTLESDVDLVKNMCELIQVEYKTLHENEEVKEDIIEDIKVLNVEDFLYHLPFNEFGELIKFKFSTERTEEFYNKIQILPVWGLLENILDEVCEVGFELYYKALNLLEYKCNSETIKNINTVGELFEKTNIDDEELDNSIKECSCYYALSTELNLEEYINVVEWMIKASNHPLNVIIETYLIEDILL